MNNKLVLALIFFLVLATAAAAAAAAAAPSPQAIQTAIAQTQTAWTPIPTQKPCPTYTELPTITSTQTPAVQTYDLQTGLCMKRVGAFSNDVDPKTLRFCSGMTTEPVILRPGEKVERIYDMSNWVGIESFCALYLLDGTFVISYVDTTGSGKVICFP